MRLDWLVYCDGGFQSVCPLMAKDKRLMKASWWDRLTEGTLGLVLMGWAMHSKSLIQFSVDGWSCVPSLIFTLGQTMMEVIKINYGTPLQYSCLENSMDGGAWWASTIVWPQVNNREGTQLHPSTENWIKDLLSMARPIRTRPSFPLSQSLPTRSFHKPLILLHQRADRLKTTITEN